MSITVNIFYTGENGNARKFANEMENTGVAGRIRKEEGNLRYEYFYPKNDEETVLLIDSWKDQEAIDRHHESPMMQEIMNLRDKYDLHMKVERYTSLDMPDGDSRFVRE